MLNTTYNLTPHNIRIIGTGTTIDIPSSGELRLQSSPQFGIIGDNELTFKDFHGTRAITTIQAQKPIGFIEEGQGWVIFQTLRSGESVLVSGMVAKYIADNHHPGIHRGVKVYVPATGPNMAVRDAGGNIIGVKAVEYHTSF